MDSWENTMVPYSWSFTTVMQSAGRWTFDEGNGRTTADSSGQGHDATLNDTAAWIPGKTGSAVSNTPTQAAASREAVRQGKAVEVADRTTATSVTYAQPDGKTFKTEIAAGPVRTKQNGKWAAIDTSLAEQGGVLKPKAIDSDVDLEVSNGGGAAFVKMTADGRRYALSWPAALPRPTVKGNTATYTDAAGRGADLVVTVLPTGFRHDVVLRERPAKPVELRIGVETGGLTLSKGKGGRLLLTGTKAGTTGKGTELVASAPQPVMWDASAGARLATGRLPQARHAKIATDVVTTGGRTELVLKPDHAFLSDPATQYPVRVDPTTTLPFNHDVEVSSTTDADWPADPTGAFMMAGTQTGSLKYRVHLRFDTTALTGATVSDAKLSLNNIDAPACGAAVGAGIQVRRLTGAWDENNLHWANKPASTTEDAQTNTAGINQNCATWPGSMDWNVTGIAQDWATGAANHGLVLQSPTETNVNNYRVFTSAEDTDFTTPPKLTVTTTGPASAPAISALTVTPAQDVSGTTTITSLTPQLAATVADPIGGTLTGQFEIEHDPAATGQGTGQIWTGTSATVTSGTQATAAVPAGKLTDGWKVRWRARAANTAASTTSAWSAWQNATIDVPGPISEPAVGALQVNPSQVVNGTTVTSTLTPTLLAQVSDPAGGNLRAEYELEHDPAAPQGQGAGQIWTGGVDNVASGTQAGIAVPAGKLTDGWKVRWRARAVAGQLSSAWSDWQQLTIDVAQPGEEPLAQTTGPVIRTDQSFTAAAWLRWNDKDGDYTVIEQKGTHQAPFRLGNTPDHGLIFTFTSADAAGATTQGVLSDVEPPVNEWFHLAGVYDATAKTATLHLNGVLVKSEPLAVSPWHADSAMTLGTRMQGGLDEVQLYQRSLTASDVAALFTGVNAVTESSSGQLAPPGTSTPKASAAVSNFNNDHISLETCYGSPPVYGKPEMARIQERPYSSCWSSYYTIGAYQEDDDTTKKIKKGGRHPVIRMAAKLADVAIDSLTDDMIFRFRATWVMHSYLGNAAGDGVVSGDGTTKPQHVKAFVRLQDFGIFQDGVRQTRFDRGLQQMNVGFDLTVSSETSSRCAVEGDSDHLKSISSWEATSHVAVMVRGYPDAAKKNAVCTIKPLITSIGGVGYIGRLWSQDVIDREGKRIGVYRNGDPPPAADTVWAPNFRCDWQTLGKSDNVDDGVPDHTGGCVNTRAHRVWTMSKSLNRNFIDVIEHIEDAMDPSKNIETFPPLRRGDTTASRDPEYPPTKKILGTEISKAIPGNWAAASNTPEGQPLYRGTNDDEKANRAVFSKHQFWSDFGTPEQEFWRKSTGTNYCKYYEYESKFKDNYAGVYDCDEYPYATTKQGAAKDKLNYSVRGIDLHQNRSHGGTLSSFYSQYRLTPDEVGDKVEDSPFWMMIVP
ncbi:hypothetical protein FHR32_006890 [Streptosporangium album]|uniref:LamG-like jellyroll fold domain-containing protein n=1 Tax=Streptosporangium album TaxID=47479 RepID=A0A7W7S236_9ACTN|nr:DNRLRE domain-containing protein [Streptosporangium album]MBB4942504.1 hypothetical protein [Streptosporangium album]